MCALHLNATRCSVLVEQRSTIKGEDGEEKRLSLVSSAPMQARKPLPQHLISPPPSDPPPPPAGQDGLMLIWIANSLGNAIAFLSCVIRQTTTYAD